MCPAIKRQTDCVRRSEVALDVSVGVRVRVRAFPSTSVLIVSQRMDVCVCVYVEGTQSSGPCQRRTEASGHAAPDSEESTVPVSGSS